MLCKTIKGWQTVNVSWGCSRVGLGTGWLFYELVCSLFVTWCKYKRRTPPINISVRDEGLSFIAVWELKRMKTRKGWGRQWVRPSIVYSIVQKRQKENWEQVNGDHFLSEKWCINIGSDIKKKKGERDIERERERERERARN